MRAQTKTLAKKFFQSTTAQIFWPSDFNKILTEHTAKWNAYDITGRKLLQFLLDEKIVRELKFESSEYRPIFRYVRDQPQPYAIALSLRHDSYLSHHTALVVHGLASKEPLIYANEEQSPKPSGSELTQQAIQFAFRAPQRRTNFVFTNNELSYVLVSGKFTGRSGVVEAEFEGAKVEVTSLERTMIDVVVRPQYAGGIEFVTEVYKRVAHSVDVERLIRLLDKIDYVYPYHQSIGFLLDRAGCSSSITRKIAKRGREFDFYLDYGMKDSRFDETWRLYYPSVLDSE
jgi:hypothetical protein